MVFWVILFAAVAAAAEQRPQNSVRAAVAAAAQADPPVS